MSSCNVDVSANKINKQEIRIAAQELIKKGFSKQESFEILKKRFHYSKIIAKILSCIPTQTQKKKYRIINYILLINLLILVSLFLSQSFYIASLTYTLLMYYVIKTIPKMYIWLTTISLISIFLVFVIYFLSTEMTFLLFFILLLLNSLNLVLSYYLNYKLCPKTGERREKYIDKEGATKIRIIYTFTEI